MIRQVGLRNACLRLILIAAAVTMVGSAAVSQTSSSESKAASPSASETLTIAEKNRVVANRDDQLVLLLDFYPNRQLLEAAGKKAPDLISMTAQAYASEYLSKPEYSTAQTAVVHIVYVESMDEYNRANYKGMKRFGTITFKRRGSAAELVENKLSFTP